MLIASGKEGTVKGNALSAGRNIGRCYVPGPDLCPGPDVGDVGLPSASDAGAHYPTAIVSQDVFGQYLGQAIPVARRKTPSETFRRLACRVFEPRCRPAELIEPRDRVVEVWLVEYLAPVDQVAFDSQKIDL